LIRQVDHLSHYRIKVHDPPFKDASECQTQEEPSITWTKAYQKRHAKARQRRRRTAAERLQPDHTQEQQAAKALELALDDLGLPENLVAEIEGRLRSQQKLLGKME
jgi:hypothetical protein